MSRTVALTQVGGNVGQGTPGGAPPAPGNPTAISVTGFIDGRTNSGTLNVSMTAPTDPGDTIVGVHLYAEIPDQSATAAFIVGTNTVGDGSTPSGSWVRLDLGKWAFSQGQPWLVPFVVDPSVNGDVNIPARLYANPYSVSYEPPLVQANQGGASPNQTFTLTSLQSGSPSAGTSVTTLTGGDGGLIGIVATPLSPVNVSGQLETPVLVDITDTPANTPDWVARLVLVVGGLDPTNPANWQVVSGIITQAGPVYAPPGDNISVPHSFAVNTPKALTSATVWLQAGLQGKPQGRYGGPSGLARWNPIVPGITPAFPITYGSTVGTLDATAILTASIDASMAIVSNAFGVAVSGIDSTRLASLAVTAAKLANSSVTATAIANAAVGNAAIANLAVDSAQIVSATILGSNIANATIAGANIASATITQANMASASIGTAQIQSLAVTDALIANVSANKLTAGTISAVTITSATITSATINGGAITGTSLSLSTSVTGTTVTTTIGSGAIFASYAGLSVSGSLGTVGVVHGGSGSSLGFFCEGASGSTNASVGINAGGTPYLQLTSSAGTPFANMTPSDLAISGLPSSNPGAGTKQFWYDPADSNRVKFAA